MDWKAVPAGKYDLIVSVLDPSGDARVVRHLDFQVLGIEDGRLTVAKRRNGLPGHLRNLAYTRTAPSDRGRLCL